MARAGGVWLEQEACGWSLSRRRVPGSGRVWPEQEACGWSRRRVAGAGGMWWLVAGAAGVSLEQPEEACNRLEQDTIAGAGGVLQEQGCVAGAAGSVWLKQEACGLGRTSVARAAGLFLEPQRVAEAGAVWL